MSGPPGWKFLGSWTSSASFSAVLPFGAHKESRREQVQTSLQAFAWSSADFLDLHDIFDLAIARPKADNALTDVVRRIDHVLKVAALSVV